MSPFNVFGIDASEYQLVLVLQADQARWFCWRDQQLVDTYAEQMTMDASSGPSHCPWVKVEPGQPGCKVRLVLDTCLDEVDRVRVEGRIRGWKNRLKRRRMIRRLQEDYPMASIHSLPEYAAPDVLSIVHHIIPAEWKQWLTSLQSENVCITHVATSLELLSKCTVQCRGTTGLAESGYLESGAGPVLLDVALDRERRHLLIDRGVPLFMRMVQHEDESDPPGEGLALLESLRHVSEQITQGRVSVALMEPVSLWPELAQSLQAASVLAALNMGYPIELKELATQTRGDADADRSVHQPGADEPDGPRLSYMPRLATKALATLGSRWCRHKRWQLRDALHYASDFLRPSIVRNTEHLWIRQMQRATLICVWMAAVSICVASVQGVGSAREKARLTTQEQALSVQVEALAASVKDLNDKPEFVMRSVTRIEEHASIKPMDAVGVMATVASAINDYPAIVLDSLSWSVMVDGQPIDLAFTAMSQVAQREQLWHADSIVEHLQVEISGSVMDVDGLGLREQQRALDDFVEHLQSLPALVEVSVMESPVNAARTSHQLDQEQPAYRLSLQMRTF